MLNNPVIGYTITYDRVKEVYPMSESKMETKAVRRLRKEALREQRRKANEPPRRPLLEEIGNAVTHGIGAALSLVALILLLLRSHTALQRTASCIYGLCLFLLFLMSCLYHAFRSGSKVKRVFRRFDYSSIYLLIGGTFAPVLLLYLDQPLGLILFIAQWILIAAGITIIGVFGPAVVKALHTAMYFILGWSALAFIPKMYVQDFPLFLLTLLGGIAYSVGAIPFAMKTRGSHFIWHLFVMLGAGLQFFGIYLYIY